MEVVHQLHDALPRWRVIEGLGVYVGSHEGGPLLKQMEVAAAKALSEGTELDSMVPLDVPHGAGVPGLVDNASRVFVLVELDDHLLICKDARPELQCRNPVGTYSMVGCYDFCLRG